MIKAHKEKQLGFSAVEVIIVIVVLALVGLIGYTVLNRQDNTDTNNPASEQRADDEESAPIENVEDLNKAEQELNDVNFDDLDTTELDSAESELL